MRLIDADMLLDEICRDLCERKYKDCDSTCEVAAYVVNAPTIGEWISVKDRMPESGKSVLVVCEIKPLYGHKKQYVCKAYYAEQYSVREGKYPNDTDCCDYCEEDDEYYLQEGWYEIIHNWDEYGSVAIADFVTHWMPLPELPKEDEHDH